MKTQTAWWLAAGLVGLALILKLAAPAEARR